jgi:RNA polymerase sigma-70 factor (ECF subfamily)
MNDLADRFYRQMLVVRCQTGEGDAFAELVAWYQPRLRYFLRKMLPDAGGTEDALQDVWLDVFRGIGRLADPGAFATWLYRIARCRAWRERRRRRLPACTLEDLDVPDPAEEDDFTAEDAAAVHAALDHLSPEHREVLLLRFMEEMSYEDIARVTGCPLGTVRSRLSYAKRGLRRALEGMKT